MKNAAPNRRQFVQATGGLLIAFAWGLPANSQSQAPAPNLPGSLKSNPRLDSWLRVETDGTVRVHSGKAELGQGVLTALAQIVAEELDVEMARIRISGADTTQGPDERYTYGSQSIELSGSALRQAGAEARAVLMAAAAVQLGASAVDLEVRDGVVSAPGGRQVTYWLLVQRGQANFDIMVRGTATPKAPSSYRIVGKPIPRIDLPAKLTGQVAFLQDLRLPEMVHGRVVRPERYGAKLLRVDEGAVRRMPGVLAVVRHGSFLGVVARREEQAIRARAALQKTAEWDTLTEPLPDPGRLPAVLRTWPSEDTLLAATQQDQPVASDALRLEASYSRPYLSHASVGPSCAVAVSRGQKMTIWSHTQGAHPLREDVAIALGVAKGDVDVIHMAGSGCYGHNGADDAGFDAALLARAVEGRPVRLQWMRDDEFTTSPLSPAMAITVRGSLSSEGKVVDWDYEVWSNTHAMRPGQPGGVNLLAASQFDPPLKPSAWVKIPQPFGDGDRNAVPVYDFPRRRVVSHLLTKMPIRCSSLRTLGGHGNMFATECFMDELATMAKADPVKFRLDHLRDPRARAVIEAAADRAGWRSDAARSSEGGRGFAYARYKSIQTYAAAVADVAIDRQSGRVRVERIVMAVDVGRVINSDGVRNQIEGGIIQAVSWTLKEQIAFDGQSIKSRDWSTYPILSFSEVPEIDIVIIDRPTEAPLGAGEGSIGPTSAAIVNAFFSATGRRIRDLPLSPDRVKQVLLT
jgi:CO/xanthine dehydrogenase Mo-binding subunit